MKIRIDLGGDWCQLVHPGGDVLHSGHHSDLTIDELHAILTRAGVAWIPPEFWEIEFGTFSGRAREITWTPANAEAH